jgi:hypothetical protein
LRCCGGHHRFQRSPWQSLRQQTSSADPFACAG